MQLALAEAEQALPLDVPVGAVLLSPTGQVLAKAHNQREALNSPTAHAELLALEAAAKVLGSWRLTGCTLVVTLEPCPMCASAIAQSRLAAVVYGATDTLYGACGSRYNLLRYPVKVSCLGGILADDCQALLRASFGR